MSDKYNYKVNYRLDFHPLAPSGFYSYICIASNATEAKRIVKQNVGGMLQEKVKVGLIKSVPRFGAMNAHRIK